MSLPRTVTLGAACGAVLVWLAAAATSNTPPAGQHAVRETSPVEMRGAELAVEVRRLRERLRPSATPLQTRDLFRYRPGVGAAAAPATAGAPTDGEPVAVLPALVLIGLAEDAGPDGPIRTAIISGLGDLFLVKEGDAVTDRYRVAKISSAVVELTDVAAGTPLRLALK